MKKVNYTLVGLFVSGAFVLLVAAIIAFSSLSFGKKTYPFILYFSDTVSGLSVGSDVKYKGVKIGSVRDIPMRRGSRDVPVIVEINSDFVDDSAFEGLMDDVQAARELIEKSGYRASLKPQNLLTGMLYVDLNLFPGTPVEWHEIGKYPEIPTIQSSISEITVSASKIFTNLAKVDFGEMARQSILFSQKMNVALDEIDFKGINENLLGASKSAREILSDASTRVMLENLGELTANLNRVAKTLDGNLDPALAETLKTLERVNTLTAKLGDIFDALDDAAEGRRGGIGNELRDTLEHFNDAMRSVRNLAEHLNNNPDSLIWGNPKE